MNARSRDDDFAAILQAVLDERADEDQQRLLAELLQDPERMQAYVAQMRMHVMLQWRAGAVAMDPPVVTEPRHRPFRAGWRWALAACLLIGLGLAAWIMWHPVPIARVVEMRNVVWARDQKPLSAHSSLQPGTKLHLEAGELELEFASGTAVSLLGPAHFELINAWTMRVEQARSITARMRPGAKGFTIDTPTARIVDFGTEFGVDVDATGRTQVVVFDGEVEVSQTNLPRPGPNRLRMGEALEVEVGGELRRIFAIEGKPGSPSWSTKVDAGPGTLISSVRDNLRGIESTKYYRIVRGGLVEDAPAYVDRTHQWNGLDAAGIPEELRNADLVMTFNEDKRCADEMEVTVTLARPAALYVILDERNDVPAWLSERFTRTDLRIGLDEGPSAEETHQVASGPGNSIDHTFSVWKLEVTVPGPIWLGPLGQKRKTMYGIAAKARP